MKEKRWKPKKGKVYWVVEPSADNSVTSFRWGGDYFDERWCKFGNCFKTKKEAKAAAEKAKALFLGLHGDGENSTVNELPKLTAAVFYHPDCPKWAKYAVVDQDGWVWFSAKKPNLVMILDKANGWSTGGGSYTYWSDRKFDASDWENSLVERPAKALPDWCRVGGWMYYDCPEPDNRYYAKITEIGDNMDYIKGQSPSGGESYIIYCFDSLKKARLRPWEFDELPRLPFEIKRRHVKLKTFVAAAYENKVRLGADLSFVYNSELTDGFIMPDSTPCGVLEHIENGEWVK